MWVLYVGLIILYIVTGIKYIFSDYRNSDAPFSKLLYGFYFPCVLLLGLFIHTIRLLEYFFTGSR